MDSAQVAKSFTFDQNPCSRYARISVHVPAECVFTLVQNTQLGVLRLAKGVGNGRLNAACARAISINAANYRSIDSILKHGLDKQIPAIRAQGQLPMEHSNVRGPDYYH
jgi:hypothetical protein